MLILEERIGDLTKSRYVLYTKRSETFIYLYLPSAFRLTLKELGINN